MEPIRDYLQQNILLFDGAMGTYFSSIYTDPLYKCEYANITSPNTIAEIHRRFLESGAKAIKTNTFSLYEDRELEPQFPMVDCIKAGFQIATDIAKDYDAYVFCDIGPITLSKDGNPMKIYEEILDTFISLGGTHFLFETFSEDTYIEQLATYIKTRVPDAYIITSFAIHPDGFTKSGLFGANLIETKPTCVDAIGFNCICGPHHMLHNLKQFGKINEPLLIMPNASYPTIIGNRVRYENNPAYFAKQMMDILGYGVQMIGGCCGTTPAFIKEMNSLLAQKRPLTEVTLLPTSSVDTPLIKTSSFYEALKNKQFPIAVELDSPPTTEISSFMAGATTLKEAGVDLITIADCPMARARMDSSLLACKLKRELAISAMPHLTCRDRNINASKALLLGLSMEEVHNILLITGDPIPSEQRKEVKSVYEFNSRMFLQHVTQLNKSLFPSPFYLYAALNINAANFAIQLKLAQKKVEKGAMAFFTQPVLSKKALENLKVAKKTLSVPILGGILPIVSHRNACFIANEIPGIDICDEITHLYLEKTKEESSELAIQLSSQIAYYMKPYIDGYYIITPFKRVDIIAKIMENIRTCNYELDAFTLTEFI